MNYDNGAAEDSPADLEPAPVASFPTEGEILDRVVNIGSSTSSWVRKRRIYFVDDLIQTLDILIYTEIALLSYLE